MKIQNQSDQKTDTSSKENSKSESAPIEDKVSKNEKTIKEPQSEKVQPLEGKDKVEPQN
jgi:hypothetical protein